jgi:hypothetical protein
MSAIGFREPPTPPEYPEHVLWTLHLRDRTAVAKLRVLPHGYELRLYVDSTFIYSTLRRDADLPALQREAAEHRAAFEGKGWQSTDAAPEA